MYPHRVERIDLAVGCASGEDTMPQSPLWLLAPDAFKGTLDACEVAQGLLEGIRSVRADLVIRSLPMADGGRTRHHVVRLSRLLCWCRSLCTLVPMTPPG